MSSAPDSPSQPSIVSLVEKAMDEWENDQEAHDTESCAQHIALAVDTELASLRSQVSELRDALREIIASNQVQVFRTIQIDSAGNTMEIIKVDGPCAAIARKALAVNSQHSDGEAK